LLSFATVKPVYNQLELHPYMTQKSLCAFCDANDIVVSCWSPLGSGTWNGVEVSAKPISDPVIQKIADNYHVSAGQIILKWDLQQGRIAIPKAESEKNIKANIDLFSFELNADELQRIDALDRNHRYGGDPDTAYAGNMKMTVPQ
jgi:diketogulonate reductase-like aldo/keto reductase